MTLPRVLTFLLCALCCASPTSLSAASQSITYPAQPGVGQGRHLVFLTGDEEYRSEEGLPMLAKILSQRHGFKCTVLFPLDPDGTINPDNNRSVPGIEVLDQADGIVMALRFRQWPDIAMKHFEAALLRGVAIVGLRTSTHAFLFRPGVTTSYARFNNFGREVLGENWVSHWGANRRGATRGVVEPGAENDPILRGVEAIHGDSGIYEAHPVSDAKILVRGVVLKGMSPTAEPDTYAMKRKSDDKEQPINSPAMAMAWTRVNKNPNGATNRVFCTTMGAASDLTNEGFRRMVVNGVLWTAGFEIPPKTDVRYVDPYAPADYRPNGFRRGLTPDDHALGQALPAGIIDPPLRKKR
ncbi:MAG: hypothetical protein RIQ93_3163 [Verrucomicrobiota bacterium]|jgi:hypothetical protein